MPVTIDSRSVERAFKKAPKVFETELRKGIKTGLVIIQREARKNHPTFTTRSGDAERSIQYKFTDFDNAKVILDTGIAKYSPYLHEGTGIFGPSGNPIKPKKKGGRLHFFAQGGNEVFAKEVDGIKGGKFLYRAAEKKENAVRDAVLKSVRSAITKAGF